MALIINGECTACSLCESECPNSAISLGDDIYMIDPLRCTECVGHYDESQCIDVCPVDCITIDPGRTESRDQLQEKYQRLMATV